MRRITLLFALFVCFATFLEGQTSLKGKVLDQKDKEVIIGATVQLLKNGVMTDGTITDDWGNFMFANIQPGTYDVNITYTGYANVKLTGVVVSIGKANKMENIFIEDESTVLNEVVVRAYKNPLIEQDNTTQGTTITSEQIAKAPVRNIEGLIAMSGGTSTTGGGVSIRGSRTNATDYYIDGIRVSGAYLPPNEIEQLQIVTGGLEAQYGDVTGGLIIASTKGPSSLYSVYLDGETSKFLDPWERSEVNASISGPILKKNDKSIIGFRFSGRLVDQLDNDPPYSPMRYIREDALAELKENPVRQIQGTTPYPAAEFNTTDLTELRKVRPNEQSKNIDLNGKLDFRINKAMDVQIGGGYSNIKDRFSPSSSNGTNSAGRIWSFANYENNPYDYTNRLRGNFRFRHKLNADNAANKNVLQNVSYTITGGYEKQINRTEDYRHEDRLFDYGYLAKYNLQLTPLFAPDSAHLDTTGILKFVQSPSVLGLQEGPLTPWTTNPTLMNYNKELDWNNIQDPNAELIGANGREPSFYTNIFTLYKNVGQVYNTFNKNERDIYTGRLDVNFDITPKNSDLGRHSFNLGFMYEQNVYRNYTINPRALWLTANNLANIHLNVLDYDSPTGQTIRQPVFDLNTGAQLDSVEVPLYNMKVDDVSGFQFYRSVRERLGIPLNQVLFVNNLTPDNLSLDMFSARELNDARLVGYYGYDHLGNKVKKASFNDFFTQLVPGTNNIRTMVLAPFTPIYQSFYIQDKFQARDVIFRLGLRVESYDANTRVMKDQYSLYEITTAQEYYNSIDGQLPSNIDPNASVYLNTFGSDASGVKAYRVGDTWFNKDGVQTQDPITIFQGEVPNPRYKLNPGETGKPDIQLGNYDPNRSFKDFVPQVNFSPRIAISFPISDEANFFGHYDMLVQRPGRGQSYASGLDFLNWESYSSFNNPDLKPEKNIDYEVGFQQKLTASSALKLSAYYKEIRDLIQSSLLTHTGNVAGNMLTYRNIDFSTVKGLQIQYDLRRTGNVTLQANYTFQFADGTGSDAETQRNIARNGSVRVLSPLDFDERHAIKLNLDYRYSEGKAYNGPELFGVDILSNTGLNVVFTTISGRPYTKQTVPLQLGGSGGIGTYNGARRPWNYNMDLRLDKQFNITGPEAKRPIGMNVYIRIANVLNTKNIYNLYRASGSAYDDGFLNIPQGQANLVAILSDPIAMNMGRTTEEYLNTYNWLKYNPDFFSGPRRIFIGANFNF